MKSFVIAVTVLICVVIFVIANSFYLIGFYDGLFEKTASLPKDVQSESAFIEVLSVYDDIIGKKGYLYLVLPHQSVNELLSSFSDVLSAAETKDEHGYALSVRKAMLILKQMKESEGFPKLF